MSDNFLNKLEGGVLTVGISSTLSFFQLEGWHDKLLDPLDEATTIFLEAFQELRLEMLLEDQVRLALLLTELLDRRRNEVTFVNLGGTHLL